MTDVILAPNKSAMKYKERTKHPLQKPILLIEKIVRAFSYENDVVLDLFSGSGTTAISCLKTNRQFIVNDINKEYYDLMNERIDNYNKELL